MNNIVQKLSEHRSSTPSKWREEAEFRATNKSWLHYSQHIAMMMLDKMEELCYYIKDNALCGLGQTAPNPVLSTLRYFRDEYIAHIVDKKCPAGVCKALLSYKIDADKCKGCTLCARNCPNGAISGKLKEPHVIDQSKCLKCGACMEKCRFGAIYKE